MLGVWVSAFTLGLGRYGHMAALLPSPQAPLGVYYLLKRKKQGNVLKAFQGLEFKGDKGRGYRRPLTD